MAATFHPELSDDTRMHQAFLDLVAERKARAENVSGRMWDGHSCPSPLILS